MASPARKKIVIVGPAYPYRGGNSLFISYVYDILKDHFNVKIFNYSLLYPSILFPGTTQYDKSSSIIKKIPSERIVNSVSPVSWIKTANRIKKENPDLVIFDWWHPFFAFCHYSISGLIKNKFKNKILFITENFISHEGHFTDRILTRIGISNASAFMALSDQVEKDVRDIKPDKKIYRSALPVFDYNTSGNAGIPVTAEQEECRVNFGFSKTDKVLLFFGYIRKYKGLDLLMDAFKILSEKDNTYKLLIAGEFYDDPDIYSKKIEELGIKNSVSLINEYIPNEEVYKYYAAADLIILPYRSATQSGILNVAYGFGKPVLVTDVGGLSEFVENEKTGIIVPPGSPEAISEGTIKFFTLRDKIDFRSNIKSFNLKNEFLNFPSLISEIMDDLSSQ